MYASASRLVTLRTSALFVKPSPALSGGNVSATVTATLSRSRTVDLYSARFRRRRGERPGVGAVTLAHWDTPPVPVPPVDVELPDPVPPAGDPPVEDPVDGAPVGLPP